MKELIKNTALLTVTCLVASGLLAAVYGVTKPKIEENKIRKQTEALSALAPEADKFTETEAGRMWIGVTESGKEICRIVKSSARGYSSTIKVLVAVDQNGYCQAVTVLEQNETPGLGTNVLSEKFQSQFKGKTLDKMKLSKDGGKLDAITGATISSKATIKAVRKGMEGGKQ